MNKFITFGIVSVVAIALVFVLLPFTVVNAGEKAVITSNGAVSRVVGAGLHFRVPLIEHAVKYDVRTQKASADASAASSDLQTVNAKVAVNYNVNPATVADMYARIGTEDTIAATIIDPAIQEVVKAVTAKYTAEQLITQRAQVTSDIQTALTQRLQPNDVVITGVSITNFDFSSQFNQAIEAKVTAQQNAEAAKNKLAQVQYEAQQTTTKAQADADAIKIKAEAINSQGGADYVKLQAIEKWNGAGCTSYCGLETANGLLLSAK